MKIESKLIKIESFQPNMKILYVNKGDVLEGYYLEDPLIGQCFCFRTVSNRLSGNRDIMTTEVVDIIDDRTFKTKNSIYKIVTIQDEREEKIKILLS